MTAPVVYRRSPRLVSRQVRGVVYVAGPGQEMKCLGGAAAVVWEALDQPSTTRQLVIEISQRWEDEGAIDETTADAALVMLADVGLICTKPVP